MDDTDYAFGRTNAEYDRLIEQGELFRPVTERMLLAAGIGRGMHVLGSDLGVQSYSSDASIRGERAGSTIARASSGSRSCSSSVEPLMSANSAVTVLRSPSIFSAAASSTRIADSFACFGEAPLAVPPIAVPQESQNFASSRFSAPHDEHVGESRAPHLSQNFALSRLFVSQFEQRIAPPRTPRNARDVSQCAGLGESASAPTSRSAL